MCLLFVREQVFCQFLGLILSPIRSGKKVFIMAKKYVVFSNFKEKISNSKNNKNHLYMNCLRSCDFVYY